MRKYKFWSNDEDKVVIDLVATHGSVNGCKKAANQLGRSYYAVKARIKNHFQPKGLIPYKWRRNISKDTYKKEIESAITKNPGNIAEALKVVAKKLNRDSGTLMNYYYSKSSVLHKSKLNPCFATIGKCFAPNSKVFKAKVRSQQSVLTYVINFLKKLWK